MACKIQNLTERVVSIRVNSGQSWHLPPKHSLDLMDTEVAQNAKVAKLVANGVLAIHREESAQFAGAAQEKSKRSRAHQE